ncbi:hypothetical protein L1049_008702 [Liquidambar formosana]|uniref:Uncharacterized protein n=1 Tax=Liquidambar formosana TaxID=63359 RepID=A0AAP0S4N9_LIQFO
MVQKASHIVFIIPFLLILLCTSEAAFAQQHNIPQIDEKIGQHRHIIGSIKAEVDFRDSFEAEGLPTDLTLEEIADQLEIRRVESEPG